MLATHLEARYGNAFDSEGEAPEAPGDIPSAIAADARSKALEAGAVKPWRPACRK